MSFNRAPDHPSYYAVRLTRICQVERPEGDGGRAKRVSAGSRPRSSITRGSCSTQPRFDSFTNRSSVPLSCADHLPLSNQIIPLFQSQQPLGWRCEQYRKLRGEPNDLIRDRSLVCVTVMPALTFIIRVSLVSCYKRLV